MPFPFKDMRDFIKDAESHKELEVVRGADPKFEIGAITELVAKKPRPEVLLFDEIKGYKPGFRVITNLFNTPRRTAAVLGLKEDLRGIGLVKAWKDMKETMKPIKAKEVSDGPVNENVIKDEKINILEFPAPVWHELDGGNFIGTGCSVVTKHPETGWVNVGTYRVMTLGENDKVSIQIAGGKHGDIIRKLYWERGKNCPIVISLGQEPTFFISGAYPLTRWNESPFDFASGLRGESMEYLVGEETGLPIPATSEIAIEGELIPDTVENVMEGPLAEWPGYYTSAKRAPVVKIKAIHYRNDPIVQGNPPLKPPLPEALGVNVVTSATLWREIEQHVPEVRGVWCANEGGTGGTPGFWVVVSIRQRYSGHAKQTGLAAAACRAGAYAGRYVIVVEEDIDPANISDVVWAICTRCDPERGIDIIRDYWDSPVDPLLSADKAKAGEITNTRAIVNACRPYHALNAFPPVAVVSPGLEAQVRKKFHDLLA